MDLLRLIQLDVEGITIGPKDGARGLERDMARGKERELTGEQRRPLLEVQQVCKVGRGVLRFDVETRTNDPYLTSLFDEMCD